MRRWKVLAVAALTVGLASLGVVPEASAQTSSRCSGSFTLTCERNTEVLRTGASGIIFVEDILAGLADGTFGPIDTNRLFATGMSSGGYMTSRMAVSHAGKFKALAIQSASYATCLGPLCSVPDDLPDDHPPTLFLHGVVDPVVPIFTMYPYRDGLRAQGTPTRTVTSLLTTHAFLPAAPHEIVAWFQSWDPGPAA